MKNPQINFSPLRDPDFPDNGQYSQSLHPSHSDLRLALEDKLEFLTESQNFWNKILCTESVDKATVGAIREEIKDEVDTLCNLAKRKKPLEINMYPPLTRIFSSIKHLSSKKTGIQRFWKDHHTQYPGVDPGVYISGLGGKEKPVVPEDVEDHTQEGPPTKRARTANQTSRYDDEDTHADDVLCASPKDHTYRPSGGQQSRGQLRSNVLETQPMFDARKPDWILLDGDSDGQTPDNPLWRQISVILELKGHSSLAPGKHQPSSSLIVQCVDYARLHLALRPFQRFSIIFSLCGTMFTAWLVDRTGVLISDNVSIKNRNGLDTFIRAVAQVTSHLTLYELGMDPTVAIHGNGSMGDRFMPRFSVTMPSRNVYITKDIPIWQSASVFGHGTVVWTVEEQGTNAESQRVTNTPEESSTAKASAHMQGSNSTLILKNAYRNEERLGESRFYLALQGAAVKGLAIFLEGGDVEIPAEFKPEQEGAEAAGGSNQVAKPDSKDRKFPDVDRCISSRLHRKGLPNPRNHDAIVHRPVLECRGQRLTEHGPLLELLQAILASIKGHESLYKIGIMHRDISIGNIFLSKPVNPEGITSGFLADLDMAKVYDETKLANAICELMASDLVKSTKSGFITGTAQFMSLSLLEEHALAQYNNLVSEEEDEPPLAPWTWNNAHSPSVITSMLEPSTSTTNREDSPESDLESFIWVMFYALLVKEVNSQPTPKARESYAIDKFNPIFGAISFEDTYKAHAWAARLISRGDKSAAQWRKSLISNTHAWTVLATLMDAAKKGLLTYQLFKEILEHYIVQLKKRTLLK